LTGLPMAWSVLLAPTVVVLGALGAGLAIVA
jgi:hypothetical protein